MSGKYIIDLPKLDVTSYTELIEFFANSKKELPLPDIEDMKNERWIEYDRQNK
ncbi:MAG: hypothetical protein J6T10_24540 [Methanobrevibacter sp.]|nr:hypothetical protein [Methanobrevibacter sp.]